MTSNTLTVLEKLTSAPNQIHVYGHRGICGTLPENTLPGFRFAFDSGLRFVELDVHVTRDKVVVLTHNPRLMAHSTRNRDNQWLAEDGPLIADLDYADLSDYDVGGIRPHTRYALKYPDRLTLGKTSIPSLADLFTQMAECGHQDRNLSIEIKSDPRFPNDTLPDALIVKQIHDTIAKYELQEQVILQSFNWSILRECARQIPDIPRSYLTKNPDPMSETEGTIFVDSPWTGGINPRDDDTSLVAAIVADGGHIWAPFHSDLTSEKCAAAKMRGLVVNVWTANDSKDINRMIDINVDGIITDYPGRVQRILMERGHKWQA